MDFTCTELPTFVAFSIQRFTMWIWDYLSWSHDAPVSCCTACTRLVGPDMKISAPSLRSALWCWIAKMRTDLSVPWGWSTQAAEDKWRWNHSDMGRIGPESEMNGWDCLPFERSTSNFAFQVGRWTRWDRMGTNTDKTLYYSLSIFW